MEADKSKIEAKINFCDHCVTHFKNLTHKIYKLLVKANKEKKTYIDIANVVKQEIVDLFDKEYVLLLRKKNLWCTKILLFLQNC